MSYMNQGAWIALDQGAWQSTSIAALLSVLAVNIMINLNCTITISAGRAQ